MLYENQLSIEKMWQALLSAQVLSPSALNNEELVINELENIFQMFAGGKGDGEVTGPTMCDSIECHLRSNGWLNEKGETWSDDR